ncbi:hypothetical protein DL96DRAFT_1588067 [Flagelloscypha sp. PMI_526]|nr:hypothetical protein DL96DRAFT_1588067 [Flagelloscypha sp. PMI_526]
MPSAKLSSRRNRERTATNAIELPFELWELILGTIPKKQLWKIRSLNRSVYFLAAQTTFGSISVTPHSGMPGSVDAVLARICDITLPIVGFVHTIHLHSNFEAYDPPKVLAKRKTGGTVHFEKDIPMNPHIKIFNLTIHCDIWVRPYASLACKTFAETLVHLELQFFTSSVLRAIPQNVYCANLGCFILICGPSGWKNPLRPPHILDLEQDGPWPQLPDSSLIMTIFAALKTILPPELAILGLHSFSGADNFWTLDPTFLHPGAFPRLKGLHVSGHSIGHDPVVLPFLLSRVEMLESLSLTVPTLSVQNQLRDLPISKNLQELFLSYKIYSIVFSLVPFQGKHPSRIIQRCTSLRRLAVGDGMSSDEAFHLLVELARGGSMVEELDLSVPRVDLRLFRTSLLLPPHLSNLTLSNIRIPASSDVTDLSARPNFWREPSYRSPCTYRFVGLGRSAMRLGRDVRQAMTKELREDIDHVYDVVFWSKQEKHALFSSVKDALNTPKGSVRPDLRITAIAKKHRQVTLQLVEGCLLDLDE